MRRGERGFTVIELMVGLALSSMIALGALAVSYQTMHVTVDSSDDLSAATQVESAGFWISRDAQMAAEYTTTGLTEPDMLVMTWDEFVYGGNAVENTVTYSVVDRVNGVGTLKRRFAPGGGLATDTIVALGVYYDPADPTGTSVAAWVLPELKVKIVVRVDDATETRTYAVTYRQNFNY